MKKIDRKPIDKIAVLSGGIIIITLIIGILFIYIPFADKNKSLRNEILRERDRNILLGNIRAFGKYLKLYEKRISKGMDVSWLLADISDMASKESIEVSSITPGSPEDFKLYTKLYIVMDTISTYGALGNFISRIESSEKFLKIENIDIKRLDADETYKKDTSKFTAYDVKANIIISTVAMKE